VQVSPVVKYDENQTLVYLNGVAQVVYRPVVEASLTAEGTTITTTPGQIGRQLDTLATAAAVKPVLLGLGTREITLIYVETPPLVLDAAAQAAAAQAIVSAPLVLSVAAPQEGDPGPWTIEPAALGDMPACRVETANAAHYEVGLDPWPCAPIEPLAAPLVKTARDAKFLFNDRPAAGHPQSPGRARAGHRRHDCAINAAPAGYARGGPSRSRRRPGRRRDGRRAGHHRTGQ
jgi:hypothetical protein